VSQFVKAAGITQASSNPNSPTKDATKKPDLLLSRSMTDAVECVSEFAAYGPVYRTSKRFDLTESDVAEYIVSCIKHTYAEYVVLQV